MKILVDLEEVRLDRLNASIPIYIYRFLDAISENEYKNIVLLISSDIKEYIMNRYPHFQIAEIERRGRSFKGIKTLGLLYTQHKIQKIIKENNIDVFFVPSDIQQFTSFKTNCYKVIVVHDLKALKIVDSKSSASTLKSKYNLYSNSILHADAVIAISNYTRDDIYKYFPNTPKEKVKVIYNSIVLPKHSVRPSNFFSSKYILYINALHPYKNVFTLVRAFNSIKDKYNHDLVIVGRPTSYWEEVVKPYIIENNLESRIIHLHDLTNENIKYLYENASLFVTTSLHEGYGYTPIEAAVLMCPVISSIEEALLDTTQGLLNYYLSTNDPQSLSFKISEVLDNLPSNDDLMKISETLLSKYSPNIFINKIYEVFRMYLSK